MLVARAKATWLFVKAESLIFPILYISIRLAGCITLYRVNISVCQKERKDNKAKLSNLKLAYDEKARIADEAKSKYEKKLQSYKDQVAQLQNSLKLADQQKDDIVKAIREEEKKMANKAIEKLKYEHEDAIVKVGE